MGNNPPKWKYNGKIYESKSELYSAILLDQAMPQFGFKDMLSLAAVLDNQGVFATKSIQMKGASGGSSVVSEFLHDKMYHKPYGKFTKQKFTHFRKVGTRITLRGTTSVGRFIGRWVGPVA